MRAAPSPAQIIEREGVAESGVDALELAALVSRQHIGLQASETAEAVGRARAAMS
jgi:hypothetical protein